MPERKCMGSLFVDYDDSPFLIAETPSEAAEMVEKAVEGDQLFVRFTAGNNGPWNGKPIYVKAECVRFISPPISQRTED